MMVSNQDLPRENFDNPFFSYKKTLILPTSLGGQEDHIHLYVKVVLKRNMVHYQSGCYLKDQFLEEFTFEERCVLLFDSKWNLLALVWGE